MASPEGTRSPAPQVSDDSTKKCLSSWSNYSGGQCPLKPHHVPLDVVVPNKGHAFRRIRPRQVPFKLR